MSLATWGREAQEDDFLLPVVEYDDFDRTTETIPVEPPGFETRTRANDSVCEALDRVRVTLGGARPNGRAANESADTAATSAADRAGA